MAIRFNIVKKIDRGHGRCGVIETPHGVINTPAFISVGTKATVKALTVEQIVSVGAEALLANTYHLYFEPGADRVARAGGLHKFMNWNAPIFTDSGGFQVFSLGQAYGRKVSKISKVNFEHDTHAEVRESMANITEEGVLFKSPIDGSEHFFSPEKSMEIQHKLGADIFFAFDECPSPENKKEYHVEAMERTHRWAKRSLEYHVKSGNGDRQSLFGIVQGGNWTDLREESAKVIGGMDFAGYGIGGSFDKNDIQSVVASVNSILDEGKPRHLLGIGEPEDLFAGVESGCDTFDCVTPTRRARNGSLYTNNGLINILNEKYRDDLGPINVACNCYTCRSYSRSYIAHLMRAKEILGATLCTMHNLHFIISLVANMRKAILEGNFIEYKNQFLSKFKK